MGERLVIASRNQHKIREFQSLLSEFGFIVVGVDEVADLPDVIEDGDTFSANAIKKAMEIARQVKCWTLADDSGLAVDILDGQPGVYSARFAGEPSNDANNNAKLLKMLAGVSLEQRTGQFCCALALADPNGRVYTYEGVCPGIITFEPRGENGFGYDPLFLVPELNMTFAELEDEAKNKISHRARAFAKLKEDLSKKIK